MRLWHAVRARLGLLLGRGAYEARLDEEMRLHLELETAANERRGLEPAEARRQALLAFGAAESYREELREGRGAVLLENVVRDVRLALRSLKRSPVFAAAAVATVALGAGVNAAMFAVLSAVLFRPLPFAEPAALVALYQSYAVGGEAERWVRWSYGEFEALRAVPDIFAGIAAYNVADANIASEAGAFRVEMEVVSGGYFAVLGIGAAAGRPLTAADDDAAAAPAVVLSHALWQRLGADAGIVGRTVRVNDMPLVVVGVAEPAFRGLSGGAELWVPQAVAPQVSFAGQLTTPQHFLTVIARLRPGVTVHGAAARLASLGALDASAARLERARDGEWSVGVTPLEAVRRHADAVRARLVLAAAVLLVLLIAMVNLAGLLLARAVARQRDVSVHAALGAGRPRLLQQALAESAVVGVLGGAAGLLLAAWAVRALPAFVPERLGGAGPGYAHLGAFADPAVDGRVLAFGFATAILAALLAGTLPALRATREAGRDVAASLRSTRAAPVGAGSLRRPTLLSAVIVVQVACAVVLSAGAGALLHAFARLHTLDTGVREEGVLSFRLTPPDSRYAAGARDARDATDATDAAAMYLDRVLERVAAVPGVVAATVSRCTPFTRCSSTFVYEAGKAAADAPLVGRHYVGPDHFRTLGIPVLRGRALTAADDAAAPRVAVISETAARVLWPGQDPIGRRVWFASGRGFDSPDTPTEVVGVVGDVLYDERVPGPEFYTSYRQFTWPATMVIVRARRDPRAMLPALRAAVAEVDPAVPIHDVATIADRRAAALSGERFAAVAVAAFALLGMLLVAVGVYGVTAYSVAQRRREIAIRLVLGAAGASLRRMVVANGVSLVAAGAAGGAVVALLLGRTLTALVTDDVLAVMPAAILAVPVLLVVALAAAWLPARRAARLPPRTALVDD